MNKIKITGVDPSLNNFGIVFLEADLDTLYFNVLEIELLRTSKKKSDFTRAQEIAKRLRSYSNRADIVITELPSGSRSARASWTLGIVLGILAANEKPIITVTPREVKMVTGDPHATKQDVFDWVDDQFRNVPWYTDSKGTPYKYNSHIADALAAVRAAIGLKFEEIYNGS